MRAFIISLLTFIFIFLCINLVRGDEIDDLIPRIIEVESSGNPNAIGKDEEIGLMQISPIVLKEWNEHYHEQYLSNGLIISQDHNLGDLYTPQINVKIGTWYLNRLVNHYLPHYNIPPTLRNILIAWNWGIGNLVEWHKQGGKSWELPKSTQRYIQKIMDTYERY